jgi:hypothetical protein
MGRKVYVCTDRDAGVRLYRQGGRSTSVQIGRQVYVGTDR